MDCEKSRARWPCAEICAFGLVAAWPLAEGAIEFLSWDASVRGEVDTVFVNSDGKDCEKSRARWPCAEICAFGPVAAWPLAEGAIEFISWDASVRGEVGIAFVNSDGMDCEKSRACWPCAEICAFGPVAAWPLAEGAIEFLSWDAAVRGEVDTAFVNSNGTDCEKSRACWPCVEICAFGPVAARPLAEGAIEFLSWDASVRGEVGTAFVNSNGTDCEKSRACCPCVEICAFGPVAARPLAERAIEFLS